jgi:excisionase family DNA binding protein
MVKSQKMVTSSKLAEGLGLSKATIIRLAKDNRIPSIILPSGHRRFDIAAVKEALANDVMASTFLFPSNDGERK